MMTYPHLLDRLLNRPLLAAPSKIRSVLGAIGPRLGVGGLIVDGALEPLARPAARGPRAELVILEEDEGEEACLEERRLYPLDRGVATLRIVGTLVNRGQWVGAHSGLVSYEGLHLQLDQARRDPEVKAIFLDFDTGGGEASGCEAAAEKVAAIAGEKPVWAALGDDALSAGYWLAAAAGVIAAPPLGGAGSIGCWSLHWDTSRALDANGVTPTLIQAGARKTLGHPFAPLDEQEGAREAIQKVVDDCRARFAAGVAAYRGLSLDAVLETEAAVLTGEEAVALGLADVVADRCQAFEALVEEVSG